MFRQDLGILEKRPRLERASQKHLPNNCTQKEKDQGRRNRHTSFPLPQAESQLIKDRPVAFLPRQHESINIQRRPNIFEVDCAEFNERGREFVADLIVDLLA